MTLGTQGDSGTTRMWQHRAIRAEIDLTVRQIDAYWERHLGTEEIARATAREDELEARVAELARERDRARETLRTVQRSASWRLTAPLRQVKGLGRLYRRA
jgi:hypothetical protein